MSLSWRMHVRSEALQATVMIAITLNVCPVLCREDEIHLQLRKTLHDTSGSSVALDTG